MGGGGWAGFNFQHIVAVVCAALMPDCCFGLWPQRCLFAAAFAFGDKNSPMTRLRWRSEETPSTRPLIFPKS
jgi:hypothetical protein